MSTEKVIVGVVAGVAVGALLGVLFAPDKGSETRRKISKKGADTVDDLKLQFDGLVTNIKDRFESGKDELAELHEKGQNHANDMKKEVKNAMN
jgi:gas vesicle protein